MSKQAKRDVALWFHQLYGADKDVIQRRIDQLVAMGIGSVTIIHHLHSIYR